MAYNNSMKIEKLIPGGQGIGKTPEGKKIFFWNVLPGEEVVEWETFRKKKDFDEALPRMILNHSTHRVSPKDPCYLSTSPWQIMDFDYELEQKRELVIESLRQEHINTDNIEVAPTQTDGKEWQYRNKMEYALYWNHDLEKIQLAFHGRGTHGKIPIEQSSIENPAIFQKAQGIIAELNNNHDEARRYQSLLLRANQQGEVSGGLFENKKPHPAFKNLTDQILGRTYSYSPNGFFQINLPVYELALREIQKHIKTEKVLDLYAGVGTIGLSVARDKSLILVENNRAAFAELVGNIRASEPNGSSSGLSGGNGRGPRTRSPVTTGAKESVSREESFGLKRAVLANSESVLDFVSPDQTVILDPPRAGCDKKLIEKLLEQTPEQLIYLSCNPATQARDVKLLADKYIIERIIPYNFFPKTPHIENLIIMSRIK